MLYWQLEKEAQDHLRKAGVDNPELSARVLLKNAAGFSDVDFILCRCEPVPLNTLRVFTEFLERRGRGEPVAHITGKKEFYGRDFRVSKDTLIPRPESELLVDLALANISEKECFFLDAGCGSGCLGLTLLAERPSWQGVLLDISLGALAIARENSRKLRVKCQCFAGNIFNFFFQPRVFNLIIANLPYISCQDKNSVMTEVLAFEPGMALFSPDAGLGHIKSLIDCAAFSLCPNGLLLLEHGKDQAHRIIEYLSEKEFQGIAAFRDLAGLPRVIMARKIEERLWLS